MFLGKNLITKKKAVPFSETANFNIVFIESLACFCQ
jgi:hypothetical protein